MSAALAVATVAAGGSQAIFAAPAAAGCPKPIRVVTTDPFAGTATTVIKRPACSGKRSAGAKRPTDGPDVAAVSAYRSKADLCTTVRRSPQPPKSDPVWGGHTDGAIYVTQCPFTKQSEPVVTEAWLAEEQAQPASITPEELAQQALAAVRVPRPVLRRSPGTEGAVTWVNLWTWVWTTPASWRSQSKTASLGSVWATVTLTPALLLFDPGDGGGSVSCPGPGRAWTPADGDGPPTKGACGYRYRSSSRGVTARLRVRWEAAWRGSGGSAGQLPDMTTETFDRFAVQQIQAVN
jgi:hypothetical protein